MHSFDESQKVFRVNASELLFVRGDKVRRELVLCQGWAIRFVKLRNERRQIVSVVMDGERLLPFSVPGESVLLSVQALTECLVQSIESCCASASVTDGLTKEIAFYNECRLEYRFNIELAVNLGKRRAAERVAHLFYSIIRRHHGVESDYPYLRYKVPLGLAEIADATGLSSVHVSRTLAELRCNRVLEFAHGNLTVFDLSVLGRMASLK